MKKIYLTIAIMLVMVTLLVYGCTPTTTHISRAVQVLATASNQILGGGAFASLPTNGIYIQAGTILNLSWSADGSLEGYIFTVNQFNNFKPMGIPSGYMAYGQGSNGNISAVVQNSDTYYGIVTNRMMLAPSVKLYQAKFTTR